MALVLMGQGCNWMGGSNTNTQVTPTPAPAPANPPATPPQVPTAKPVTKVNTGQTLSTGGALIKVTYKTGVSPCPTPLGTLYVSGASDGSWKMIKKPTWINITTTSGKLTSAGEDQANVSFNCTISNYTTHTEPGTITVEAFDKAGKSTGQVVVTVQVDVVKK